MTDRSDPPAPVLLWFRQDLRLDDNPALAAAAAEGPVIPVFILDDETPGRWAPGGASRWWLHHSLAALGEALEERGLALILRRGRAGDAIRALARETGACAVHWNRCYEPWAVDRDTDLKASLKEAGIAARSHNAALLWEPWEIETKSGSPYRVFTPFYKAARDVRVPDPVEAPGAIEAAAVEIESEALDSWALLPSEPDWAGGLRDTWTPGEAGARERAANFLDTALYGYQEDRDKPAKPATSGLSPHLHFGEIGPRRLWHAIDRRTRGGEAFTRELAWREFSHHLLYHQPEMPDAPLRPEFADFGWRDDPDGLKAWQKGRTGYPLVDAGLRELWHTGWMHNRVRMVAASFLIKHLLVPWQEGEAWFWDTLVDADLANNAASWQWVAGCGADASPFFRIFNPVAQSRKFDPAGTYLRRWLPELADLSDDDIHAPWEASPEALEAAGVTLGETYPKPIVDHKSARQRALDAYTALRDDS